MILGSFFEYFFLSFNFFFIFVNHLNMTISLLMIVKEEQNIEEVEIEEIDGDKKEVGEDDE